MGGMERKGLAFALGESTSPSLNLDYCAQLWQNYQRHNQSIMFLFRDLRNGRPVDNVTQPRRLGARSVQ